jgi:hypothetical protein
MLPFEVLLSRSGLSRRAFRDRVGTFSRNIEQAETSGLNVATADLWSTRLGLHPAEVFGIEAWTAAIIAEGV